MDFAQTIERADLLLLEERVEDATKLLTSYLESNNDPIAWQRLGRSFQIAGDEVLARAVFRNVLFKLDNPHIVDVIAARIPYGKPHVFDDLKLVYFSIPKCASSTIKDACLIAKGEKPSGDHSHKVTRQYARLVSFKELYQDFADYFLFAIVRAPHARLRSYWMKNIEADRSLVAEARGKNFFYGLSTRPSYAEIIRNFYRYRAVFRDFRHHTDSLTGYIGDRGDCISNIFDISETNNVIRMIGDRAGVKIPYIQNMRSPGGELKIDPVTKELETELVDIFYADELRIFFSHAH